MVRRKPRYEKSSTSAMAFETRCLICYKQFTSDEDDDGVQDHGAVARTVLRQIAEIHQIPSAAYNDIAFNLLQISLLCSDCESLISDWNRILREIAALKCRLKEVTQVMKETFIRSYISGKCGKVSGGDLLHINELDRIRNMYAECWVQCDAATMETGGTTSSDEEDVKEEPEDDYEDVNRDLPLPAHDHSYNKLHEKVDVEELEERDEENTEQHPVPEPDHWFSQQNGPEDIREPDSPLSDPPFNDLQDADDLEEPELSFPESDDEQKFAVDDDPLRLTPGPVKSHYVTKVTKNPDPPLITQLIILNNPVQQSLTQQPTTSTRINPTNPRFTCELCLKEFESVNYNLHYNNHGSNIKTISSYIDARVDDESRLLAFECKLCDKVYPQLNQLISSGKRLTLSIKCDHGNCICTTKFRELSFYMQHHQEICTLSYKEKKEQECKCSLCGYKLGSACELEKHIQKMHQANYTTNDPKLRYRPSLLRKPVAPKPPPAATAIPIFSRVPKATTSRLMSLPLPLLERFGGPTKNKPKDPPPPAETVPKTVEPRPKDPPPPTKTVPKTQKPRHTDPPPPVKTVAKTVEPSPAARPVEVFKPPRLSKSGIPYKDNRDKTNMCPVCSKIFYIEKNFQKHLKTHSGPVTTLRIRYIHALLDDKNKPISFTCKVCNQDFTKVKYLNSDQELSVQCDHGNCTCEATFNDFNLFMRHHNKVCTMRYKHKTVGYSCPDCGILSPKFQEHLDHRRAAHDQGTLCCEICGKTFCLKYKLSYHLKTAHTEKEKREYVCHVCGKIFTSRSGLKRHTVVSHDKHEPRFMCEVCGRGFAIKSSLQIHLPSHSSVYNTPCPECGRLFKSKRCVKAHIYAIHKGGNKKLMAKRRAKRLMGKNREISAQESEAGDTTSS